MNERYLEILQRAELVGTARAIDMIHGHYVAFQAAVESGIFIDVTVLPRDTKKNLFEMYHKNIQAAKESGNKVGKKFLKGQLASLRAAEKSGVFVKTPHQKSVFP